VEGQFCVISLDHRCPIYSVLKQWRDLCQAATSLPAMYYRPWTGKRGNGSPATTVTPVFSHRMQLILLLDEKQQCGLSEAGPILELPLNADAVVFSHWMCRYGKDWFLLGIWAELGSGFLFSDLMSVINHQLFNCTTLWIWCNGVKHAVLTNGWLFLCLYMCVTLTEYQS